MELNVLCLDKVGTIDLVKVTNGLPLNFSKDHFLQEIEVPESFDIKTNRTLYALIVYTDNDIYVHSLYETEKAVESKYQQLMTGSDKTYSITTVEFKKAL